MTDVLGKNTAPPTRRSVFGRLSRRVAERNKYGGYRDWLWSLYNRLLGKRQLWFLPFRHRVKAIHVRGINGALYVRLGTTDFIVVDEVFMNGEYAQLLASDLGEIKQVLDLGANVGFSIRLWQERFRDARIVAVEPDPGNVEVCRRNVAAGPAPNLVTVIQACVAGTARHVALDRSRGEYAFSMTDLASDGNQQGDAIVEAVTVPQVLRDGSVLGPIDLLKCDIEGAEKEVFAQCRDWIGRVNYMVVELHQPYQPEQFFADLTTNGADFEVLSRTDKGGPTVLVLRNRKATGAI